MVIEGESPYRALAVAVNDAVLPFIDWL